MNKKDFSKHFNKHFKPIQEFFGLHNHNMIVKLISQPNDDDDDVSHTFAITTTNGWYKEAEMEFYYRSIPSEKILVETIFHEFIHVLLCEPFDSLDTLLNTSFIYKITGLRTFVNDSASQANELLVSHLSNCLLKHYLIEHPLEKGI